MMNRPLLLTLAAFISGIILELFCNIPAVFLICMIISMISLGMYEILKGNRQKSYICFLFAFLLAGLFSSQWQREVNTGNIKKLANKSVCVIGTVTEEPQYRGGKINYILRVEDETLNGPYRDMLKGKILLTVNRPLHPYEYGDRLEITGVPEIPAESGNPGEFNYKKYLEQQGIQLVLKKWQETGIKKLGQGELNPFVDLCIQVKNSLKSILYKTMPQNHAAIMEGVLFGTMGGIDQNAKADFSVTGVIHIFSVSGYHVGILVLIFAGLGELLGLKKMGRILLIVSATLFYAIMTGATPPVMRASIMTWIMLMAKYADKEYDWVTSLSAAALILLLYNPHALYDPGFQLSFVATWGLFYLMPVIKKMLPITAILRDSISVTLAAQIAVLPITSYYFNYLSFVSLPANLIIVPLISIIMLLGGMALLGGLLWLPFAGAVNITTGALIELIIRIAHMLAGIPFATIDISQPSLIEIVMFYLAICFLVEMLQTDRVRIQIRRYWYLHKKVLLFGGIILLAVFLWCGILFPEADEFEVMFLNVGQGDCTVLKSPGGKHILIDTGGAYKSESGTDGYDPGEKILVPYLIREGIKELDLLILTHPHLDHYGGAAALIGKIDVPKIMISSKFTEDPDGAAVISKFVAAGTEVEEIEGGETIVFDENIILEMLNTAPSRNTNVNNGSLITRVGYGTFHLMFSGDAEQVILDELAPKKLSKVQSDIIKVPHHGSPNAWSDKFYDAVDPEIAVISVGQHNNFGHPARAVLDSLNKRGIEILRTDQQGAISFTSDGKSYDYKTGKDMSELGF